MSDTLVDLEVDDDQFPEPAPSRRISVRRWVALLVIVVVAAASAVVAMLFVRSSPPGTDSAEAGFARDMQQHHAQAVEMSLIVLDRTENDGIRTIAYDIATTQQQQQGQMYAWLVGWDLPQARSGPVMAWMDGSDMAGMAAMTHSGAMMPGMATTDDLAELRSLSGTAAEVLYLQLLIAHHKGGIQMARAVLGLTDNRQVTLLANAIVASQQSEISAMETMLAERGATDRRTG